MREAVGDAMGVLACAAATAAPNLAGGEAATNPLLRAALDALGDQKQEVQAAAAHAFAQARLMQCNFSVDTHACALTSGRVHKDSSSRPAVHAPLPVLCRVAACQRHS